MIDDEAQAQQAEDALLDESIGELRIAGRIVQHVTDPEGCYRVDGGSPHTFAAIVALAWDANLVSGPAEV